MSPLLLLSLATLGLFVGPLIGGLGRGSNKAGAGVDGFALVVVTGLCLGFGLPHAVSEGGLVAAAFAGAGVALPALGHRLGPGRMGPLGPLLVVLAAHVVLDGAILSMPGDDAPLGWAVVAHRLPVGFALFMAVQASGRPPWIAAALAVAMAAGTIGGFLLGPPLIVWLPEGGVAGLEAFVAGVLLHVVLAPHAIPNPAHEHAHTDPHGCSRHRHHGHAHEHAHTDPHACSRHRHHGHAHELAHTDPHACNHHHHGHAHDHAPEETPRASLAGWSATGALAGLLVLIAMAGLGGVGESDSPQAAFLKTLGVLLLESAPALLLGYTLAGVVPSLLTQTTIGALERGGRLGQSLRGVAFGLPLPVCSCGVLPLYESLIRRGAPPAAALAFFVATPELGLDALLLSVPLLGSELTIARLVSAFAVAMLVGALLGRDPRRASTPRGPSTVAPSTDWRARLRGGLRFGFVEVFDHTMPWIAVGLVVAALAEPLLSHEVLARIPAGLQVPLTALAGVPMYVCASGATPLAAIALHKGMSSGAALAFLIAGPATNLTTFGVLARLHGRRLAALFAVSVTALAIVAGWTVDALGVSAVPVLDPHAHPVHASWLAWLCLGLLAALMSASLFRQGPRGALRQILNPIHAH